MSNTYGAAAVEPGAGRHAAVMLAATRLAIIPDEVMTMEKPVTYQIEAEEVRQLEAAVNECVVEMQQANQRMEGRQVEIDKLKAETRAMLNQIRSLRAA